MSNHASDYEHGQFDFNRLDEPSKGYAGDDLILGMFSYIDWMTGDPGDVKKWRRGFNAAFDEYQQTNGY